MFNNRRLSSDRAVIDDLINIAGSETVWINSYSAALFAGYEDRISVSDRFLMQKSGFCFAEYGDFLKIRHSIDTLIVYKWNRNYPSDMKFPLSAFLSQMRLKSAAEFEGASHSKITREVYVR